MVNKTLETIKEKSKSAFKKCVLYLKTHKKSVGTIIVLLAMICILQLLRQSAYVREYIFSRGISRWLLYLLSRYSNLFPFSITELTLYLAIVFVLIFIVKTIKSLKKVDGKRDYTYLCGFVTFAIITTLSINVLFLTLFTMSYERDSAIPQLNLPEATADAETVSAAAIYFANKAEALEDNFEIDENGNVVSPYTFDEIAELILVEYQQFDSDFFSQFETYPKQLAFGFINSYAGFTGYYSPFFAESNVNTYSPVVSQPVTMAHELAHSKGIMRENEANFFAYYVLANAEDEYLQYCGYVVIAQILLSESYDSNNTEIYANVLGEFSETTIKVINSKYYFWQDYDTIFDDIGDWFNNLYLTSSGITSGSKSYGETANILVRLYVDMEGKA